MRKQDTAALRLFVSSLEGRWHENQDYFMGMRFVFSSGRKRFEGRVSRGEGEMLSVSFGGEKREQSFAAFADFYVTEALRYDTAVLEYRERGAVLTVEADERGVRTRQTDAKPEEEVRESSVLPDRDYIIRARCQRKRSVRSLRLIGLCPNPRFNAFKVFQGEWCYAFSHKRKE